MREDFKQQEDGRFVAGPDLSDVPEDKGWPVRIGILGVVLVVALTTGVLFLGGDEAPRTHPEPVTAPAAAAPISDEREAEFERGLSEALANIIATVPDPNEGLPQGEFVLQQFQQMTGCAVTDVKVNTFPTKRKAKGLAVRAVEYAEPDWHDQYVGVTVEVSCD